MVTKSKLVTAKLLTGIVQCSSAHTGAKLNIRNTSGMEFPEELTDYALIIHCGGCMLNEKEVQYRRKFAQDSAVPFTNYGIAIAYMQGILKRTLSVFPDLEKLI